MPVIELSELKAWRNKHGISQEKLASISGLGVNTIAKIETGIANLQEQTEAKLLKFIEEFEANSASAGVAANTVVDEDAKEFQQGELKAWRTSYGISQEKLSTLAQLGINTIAKIESGVTKILPQTAIKLRRIIGQVESGEIPIAKPEPIVDHMVGFDPNELKAWRKKHGISQDKLAKSAKLGINTILKLENGNRVEKATLLSVMQSVREFNKGIKEKAAQAGVATPVAPPAIPPVASPKPAVKAAEVAPAPKKRRGRQPKIRTEEPKPVPKVVAPIVAKPKEKLARGPKTTAPFLGVNFDLKTWRKRFALSQGKLADMAQLSLNTIMKFEAGAKDVQKRTLDRLLQAIKSVEDKVTVIPAEAPKPVATAAASVATPMAPVAPARVEPVAPKPVAITQQQAPAKVETAAPSAAAPIQLTNLDLELINRVIVMSTKEKLRMLSLMMENDSDA